MFVFVSPRRYADLIAQTAGWNANKPSFAGLNSNVHQAAFSSFCSSSFVECYLVVDSAYVTKTKQ